MTEFAWGMLAGWIIGAGCVGCFYYAHYHGLCDEITKLRQWGIRQRREKYF